MPRGNWLILHLTLYEVRNPYREVKYDWWYEQRFRQ